METGKELLKIGCTWQVVAAAEVNGKIELDEALVDDANTTGALPVAAAQTEDPPKENPVD